MAEFPTLSIWVDAYVLDTRDLTMEEHGIYHMMLYTAWSRPDNALPNDMKWLKRALGGSMHGHTFNARVRPVLERFWHLEADGKWHQKRLDIERQNRRKLSSNASQNSLKRWGDSNKTKDLADATASLPHMLPTLLPEEEEERRRSVAASARVGHHINAGPNGSKFEGEGGRGNGGARSSDVTTMSPDQKLAVFQQKRLVPRLGPSAWTIIEAAMDENNPAFARSLTLCKQAANQSGAGWPHDWPITPKKP